MPGEGPPPQTIREHLAKVLSSATFREADRPKRFLGFIVEETLAGREYNLKGSIIATEVFGGVDKAALVAPEAGRLRGKLLKYYDSEGSEDLIRIRMPTGGYKPIFSLGTGHAAVHPTDQPVTNWISRLNFFLGGGIEVCHIVDTEPLLVSDGLLSLSDEEAALVVKKRAALKVNDEVALLVETPILNPAMFRVKNSEYAVVAALAQLGRRPTQMVGAALVVCTETKEVILQRRSEESRDYPYALHVFGGSYSPRYDRNSLVHTARRETLEESGLTIDITKIPAMMLVRELDIRFVQLVLLGMQVSRRMVADASPNPEGWPTRIKFDDLDDILTGTESWVPSAKAHILGWLALGAPVFDGPCPRFRGLSGQKLFESIIPSPSPSAAA